jgi:hypothetical protein
MLYCGNSFHSLAAAYRKDFRPYLVVRTEGISVMLSYLKQYLVSLILIKSCKSKLRFSFRGLYQGKLR